MKVLAFSVAVAFALAVSGDHVWADPIYADSAVAANVLGPGNGIPTGTPSEGDAFPWSMFGPSIPLDGITGSSGAMVGDEVGSADTGAVQQRYAARLSEPVSLLLLAAGLAATAAVRRRRAERGQARPETANARRRGSPLAARSEKTRPRC